MKVLDATFPIDYFDGVKAIRDDDPEALIATTGRELGSPVVSGDSDLTYPETNRAVDVERLRERGIEAETAIIPNGIDVDRFPPNASANWVDLAADRGHPYLLFVGRLHLGKIDNLVDTLSLVRSEILHSVLFVGDGPDRAAYSTTASQSPGGEVDPVPRRAAGTRQPSTRASVDSPGPRRPGPRAGLWSGTAVGQLSAFLAGSRSIDAPIHEMTIWSFRFANIVGPGLRGPRSPTSSRSYARTPRR